jgi:dTDP-4-amino-4,6-dideoxygalactose transaminase
MKKSKSKIKIPLFSPSITSEDKKSIDSVLRNQILTGGPTLEKFEKMFAKFTGVKYAIGVSNATSALFLSLKSIGIKKDDEVIIPDMTFVATANAVIHAGGKPVLIDVNLDDMNISVEAIKKVITKKTKAILPVHFAGKACHMEKIKKIAKENNLFLIEDCAHAIGTFVNKKHVGTFGEAGCFSFYPTKNITTIEGGMVITNSKKIAEKIKNYRNHGITKTLSQRYNLGKPWEYDVVEPGYNFRLDEIRSSLGISQLKRIKKMNARRESIFNYYNKNLSKIKGVEIPIKARGVDSHHLYIIRIKKKYSLSRDELFKKLSKEGISTTLHYKPLHLFSAYKKYRKMNLKNSIQLFNEILSLPFFPDITKNQQNKVIKSISKLS